MNDPVLQSRSQRKGQFRQSWKESHGTALLGFAGIILIVGMLMIWANPPADDTTDVDLLIESSGANAPALPPDVMLVRVVTDQITSNGPIRIAIYDSKDTFGVPDRAVLRDSHSPVEGFVVWEIDLKVLPDEFSIAAFHDLDGDGKLNRGVFNAPTEPYGFSNNARGLVGPPTYEATIMQRPESSGVIEIRVF